MMPQDDEDKLLGVAVAGDQAALSELLARHGPPLAARIAAGIGAKWRSVLDADDVMQVTYVEAFLHIRDFVPRGPGAFAAWLRRIAENNLRDAIASLSAAKRPPPERRIQTGARDESAAVLLENLGVTLTTPSLHLGRSEARSALEAAIERLPSDYARVITLYDLEALPAEEVAARLERSQGAVFMLRARALDRLRDALGTGTIFEIRRE